MPAARKKRVAILGGGMAGLSAAWALSDPDARAELDVCVFERAPHLGGKGASTRGVHGRIEEHGLHVWLGYYDNAFRLIREVYEELDRPSSDPDCPLLTWRDAFAPADLVGVEDRGGGGSWSHWVASFGRNGAEPGSRSDAGRQLSAATFVRRGLALLLDFSGSLGRSSRSPGVTLSGSAEPPPASGPAAFADLTEVLRRAEIAALVGAMESIRLLQAAIPRGGSLAGLVVGYLDRMRADVVDRVHRDDDARRSAELADIVISAMQGTIRDGLLTEDGGFAAVDELDFRDWLARHGARPETLDCALIRGMYDLVFAYEDGDPSRPRFPAGLGLFLAGKFFFEYSGSIFWRMQAGMGDVVFAPLYQALLGRGVRFALGHRVERLKLSRDRARVDEIVLTAHRARRDPLVRVKGLPCFPSRSPVSHPRPLVLSAGEDFDDVVLAASLGALPGICGELLEDSAAWRNMAAGLATVPTQSLQVWLREDEAELGWPYPGATVSGYVTPFDTYASMSHLLPREDWPDEDAPRALGYFCSVLPPDAPGGAVRSNAERFLSRDVRQLWPAFRWELLCGTGLDSQYWRANVDPSEQYVQSLPGTGRLRLRADESGYDNLFLAGDWIDSGLNAGCIEAAVLAGIQAANAVRGCPRGQGIVGSWLGVEAA